VATHISTFFYFKYSAKHVALCVVLADRLYGGGAASYNERFDAVYSKQVTVNLAFT
jgi:hypothetical protein